MPNKHLANKEAIKSLKVFVEGIRQLKKHYQQGREYAAFLVAEHLSYYEMLQTPENPESIIRHADIHRKLESCPIVRYGVKGMLPPLTLQEQPSDDYVHTAVALLKATHYCLQDPHILKALEKCTHSHSLLQENPVYRTFEALYQKVAGEGASNAKQPEKNSRKVTWVGGVSETIPTTFKDPSAENTSRR